MHVNKKEICKLDLDEINLQKYLENISSWMKN